MAHATVSELMLELSTLMDAARIRRPHNEEARYAAAIARIADADELAELVRKCEADRLTLAAVGKGRTLSLVRPYPVDFGISLEGLSSLVDYEPDDMTVVAQTGMTLAELNTRLAVDGQHLPLDPPHPETITLGALIGTAVSGPQRLSRGTLRDWLIGIRFVGHGGRSVHAGARVVKNVAGYDLMKLMIGSFGTLGIVTEAIFKVFPTPEQYVMVILPHDDCAAAFATGSSLIDSLQPLHVDLLSPGLLREFGEGHLLMVGLAGNRPDIDYQLGRISRLEGRDPAVLEGEAAQKAYLALRDLALPSGAIEMQISVPIRELPGCLAVPGLHFCAHVGSGVARVVPEPDSYDRAAQTVAQIRKAVAAARGHSRLRAVAAPLRSQVAVFDLPPAPQMALMRRLKATFDPARIFNPGCFVGGL